MLKKFKLLMAVLLVSCGATVFAQCIPMNAPGPPRYWDGVRGCYVPQGTPAVNSGTTTTTQSVFGNVQPYGQQVFSQGFAQNNGFTNCQLVGGVIGATLGSLVKHHTAQAVILGAIGGGVVGNMYCTNNQGQRIVVQQAPQQVQVQTQATPSPSCANDPGSKLGILHLPGHEKDGQTVCARPGDTNVSFF